MNEVNFRYGQERKFADDVEQTRTIEFIISTPTKDRHRTILNPKGWNLENFNKNGIVGYQHNVHGGDLCFEPNPDNVIGKAFAYLEGDNLIGRVTFEPADINPLAEKIFRKVLFGSLRATSVGFLPVGKGHYGEGKEGQGRELETYYFEGQELLEFSIVNIPSNPDAVGRSLRDQTHNALMYVKKALGEDYSFGDIEKMTVGEVLRLIPKNGQRIAEPVVVSQQKVDVEEVAEVVAESSEEVAPEVREIEQEETPVEAQDNGWTVEAEARNRELLIKLKSV